MRRQSPEEERSPGGRGRNAFQGEETSAGAAAPCGDQCDDQCDVSALRGGEQRRTGGSASGLGAFCSAHSVFLGKLDVLPH